MKHKTIRTNVFETNSSSSHSITFSTTGTISYPEFKQGYILPLRQGDFGWEWKRYNVFWTKLSYAYTLAKTFQYNTPRYLEMLFTTLKDIPNVEEFDEHSYEGYVDHQSQDLVEDIFESEDSLKNFLFNSSTILTTDKDNH